MESQETSNTGITVGKVERWGSMLGGGALLLYGLTRRSLGGVALAVLGGDLVYHGLVRNDGHLHEVFGLNKAADENPAVSIPHGHGIKVSRSINIDRSPEELYQFWRDLSHLPQFMDHLESVQVIDDLRSHWVAKAPAGMKVEWDAEIVNDVPNELIAWRSLEGSDVPNAGSVHFERSSRGHGTKMSVILKYDPPAGPLGIAFARLFGEAPSQTIRQDLYRFKRLMQTQDMQPASRIQTQDMPTLSHSQPEDLNTTPSMGSDDVNVTLPRDTLPPPLS